MPTTFLKGDLLNHEGIRAYAVGANVAGTMDSGVAVALRKRWPAMFDAYRAACDAKTVHAGDVLEWKGDEHTVYLLFVQETEKERAKLPAIQRATRRLVELAEAAGIARVAVSRIGAGAGGTDWPRVKSLLEEATKEHAVELVVFEQFVRAKG